MMLRIVLVDDQTLVRSGIKGLLDLTPDLKVVGEADDAAGAIDLIARVAPDLVLLDIRMPGGSGIEVLHALGQRQALPPTILLTTFDDDGALLDGMRAGAKGFLLKDISLEHLAEAIRRVAGGATLFRPGLTERVLRGLQAPATPAQAPRHDADALTAREIEILRLMTGGFNNREIAEALHNSEGTIKNHVSSILSKLGVRDRVRAVLRGVSLGYV
jgi:DNA-binding NarL/FixJ family response regulator